MYKLSLLLLFTTIFQFNGQCDTITNWQVYHNQKLIHIANSFSEIVSITLKKSDIKPGDSITVHYFRDTPCYECPSQLSIENEKHFTITTWKGKGTFTPKVFYLNSLLKTSITDFEIWYFEGDLPSKTNKELLFRLRLE